jgi:hypothetical protein
VRELAVLREALHRVVDVAVGGRVGVASLDELLYERDHLGDVLRGPRLDVREADAEEFQSFVEGAGVAAYDLLPGDALLVGPVYDLVLYIRYVLDELDVVAAALQVPDHHVPEQGRPYITDVGVVVDRRPADVEVDPAVLADLDEVAAQSVVHAYAHISSLARSIRERDSSAPRTANR